jgi:hypothetical protein
VKAQSKLYKIIVTKTGRPDRLAIHLYLDIKSHLQKNKRSIWETNYQYFVDKYKLSKESIRRKLALLEKLNLIYREVTLTTITGFLYSGHPNIWILGLSLVNKRAV